MKPIECVQQLLDQSKTMEEKNACIFDYLDEGKSYRRIDKRIAQRRAIRFAELFKAVKEDKDSLDKLQKVILEITTFGKSEQYEHKAKAENASHILKHLSPGIPVVIIRYDREDVVFFLKARRNTFEIEFPDGLEMIVPNGVFVRVHEGTVPERLPEEDKKIRANIRAILCDKKRSKEIATLVSQDAEMIPYLMAEMAAVQMRIKNAPTYGNRKMVMNEDLILVRSIQLVLGDILLHLPDKYNLLKAIFGIVEEDAKDL